MIRDHRGAVEYDLRHRFNLGLRDAGDKITLSELGRLMAIVKDDPSSATAAALAGWTHPISREAVILMDLFDLEHAVNSKKRPKPHPGRPWRNQSRKQMGKAGTRTNAEVVEILAQARDGVVPV